jgi:hypothetical protein
MMRVRPFLLLLCLPLAQGVSGNVQLTGLVELGRRQKAYLLLDENRSVELAVGQTRGGYTLLRLDVRAGWCELLQGSNVVQLCFSSPLAPPGVASESVAEVVPITTPTLASAAGTGMARPTGVGETETQGMAPTPPEEDKTATNALYAAAALGAPAPSANEPQGPPQAPPLTGDQLLRIRLGGNGFNDLMRQRMWAASQGLPLP